MIHNLLLRFSFIYITFRVPPPPSLTLTRYYYLDDPKPLTILPLSRAISPLALYKNENSTTVPNNYTLNEALIKNKLNINTYAWLLAAKKGKF